MATKCGTYDGHWNTICSILLVSVESLRIDGLDGSSSGWLITGNIGEGVTGSFHQECALIVFRFFYLLLSQSVWHLLAGIPSWLSLILLIMREGVFSKWFFDILRLGTVEYGWLKAVQKDTVGLDTPNINFGKGYLILPRPPQTCSSCSSLPRGKPQNTKILLPFKNEIWHLYKNRRKYNQHNDYR